jgi:hypothetical protein
LLTHRAGPDAERILRCALKERRHQAVESVHANNRIAGIAEDLTARPIFQAFIDGDIDIEEMGRQIDALMAARERNDQ